MKRDSSDILSFGTVQYTHLSCMYNAYSLHTYRWSKTSPKQRSSLLLKIADQIEARQDEFAEAESRDQGKPVWLAKKIDIPRAIHNFRFFATGILHTIET